MADHDCENVINKLVQARENGKKKKHTEAKNTLFTLLNSNPFLKEGVLSVETREEGEYIKTCLEGDGLKVRVTSELELSKKISSIKVIVQLPPYPANSSPVLSSQPENKVGPKDECL